MPIFCTADILARVDDIDSLRGMVSYYQRGSEELPTLVETSIDPYEIACTLVKHSAPLLHAQVAKNAVYALAESWTFWQPELKMLLTHTRDVQVQN